MFLEKVFENLGIIGNPHSHGSYYSDFADGGPINELDQEASFVMLPRVDLVNYRITFSNPVLAVL